MVSLPKRNKLVAFLRSKFGFLEFLVWYPFQKPEYYQVVCLLLSIFFPLVQNNFLKILFVAFIILLDWYDGAAARKYNKSSPNGWLSDVAVDRVSEGLLFINLIGSAIGKLFFAAYLINIILSYKSYVTKKHFILPLRFFFLIYLLITSLI